MVNNNGHLFATYQIKLFPFNQTRRIHYVIGTILNRTRLTVNKQIIYKTDTTEVLKYTGRTAAAAAKFRLERNYEPGTSKVTSVVSGKEPISPDDTTESFNMTMVNSQLGQN